MSSFRPFFLPSLPGHLQLALHTRPVAVQPLAQEDAQLLPGAQRLQLLLRQSLVAVQLQLREVVPGPAICGVVCSARCQQRQQVGGSTARQAAARCASPGSLGAAVCMLHCGSSLSRGS